MTASRQKDIKSALLRGNKFTPSPQLKRACCCYWTVSMSSLIAFAAISYFADKYVLQDELLAQAAYQAEWGVFITVCASVLCGIIYKCDITNPIISLVGIASLFVGPYYCIHGVRLNLAGKNAVKNTNVSFYLNELKNVWVTHSKFPDWITYTQRYHKCCGILSFKDYRVHLYGENGDLDFPQSCCELREWERLYKDPEPLEHFCNYHVFNTKGEDHRLPSQIAIEDKMYKNLWVPKENEGVDYLKFYTKGCYRQLVNAGTQTHDYLLRLQIAMCFWCFVLLVIHVVRLDSFCRQPVMTSEDLTAIESAEESDETSSEEQALEVLKAQPEAEKSENKVRNLSVGRKSMRMSKGEVLNSKDDPPDSLLRLFKRHRKYASDSESIDETDTEEMKRMRGTFKPRDRFEFLVSIHRDCPEELHKYDRSDSDSDEKLHAPEGSANQKKQDTSTKGGGVKRISPTASKVYMAELRKLEHRKKHKEDLKQAIREQRNAESIRIDNDRRLSYDSPSDIFLHSKTEPKKTKFKFRGPAFSETQKEILLEKQRERKRQKESNRP